MELNTRYLRVEKVSQTNDTEFWKIIQLRELLANSYEHLIYALAPALASPVRKRVILVPQAGWLLSGLASIGLIEKDRTEFKSNEWPAVVDQEVRLNGLQPFLLNDCPVHNLDHDWREYVEFCRIRESYILGLSKNLSTFPSAELSINPGFDAFVQKYKRSNPDIGKCLELRNSETSFDSGYRARAEDVLSLLTDFAAPRPDGSFNYAVAGGFPVINTQIFVVRSDEMAPGCYRYSLKNKMLEAQTHSIDLESLVAVSFGQEWVRGPAFWFIISVDVSLAGQKYGARALRFATLSAGAVLHQIGLSSVSYGLSARILGGFDDLLVRRLFAVDQVSETPMALIGIGKSSE